MFEIIANNKQIIISSDRATSDLKQLEDRLLTRFAWGLQVNIFPPDYTLKMEIIRKKIIADHNEEEIPALTNEVLNYTLLFLKDEEGIFSVDDDDGGAVRCKGRRRTLQRISEKL